MADVTDRDVLEARGEGTMRYEVDAILFERDPGEWVAQCLQYDIGAQAGNLPDLLYELQKSIVGHIVIALDNGVDPLECYGPAPQEYWEKWEHAKAKVEVETKPFRMPKHAPKVLSRLKIATVSPRTKSLSIKGLSACVPT